MRWVSSLSQLADFPSAVEECLDVIRGAFPTTPPSLLFAFVSLDPRSRLCAQRRANTP